MLARTMDAAPPFIVLSLPRSRSAWLSQFLSYGDWQCGHDQLRYMRSLDDVKSWLAMPNAGTCETGGASFWRLLKKYAPDIRVVTVRRDVEEVTESLMKAGLATDYRVIRKMMTNLDRKLDQIEGRMGNVLSVHYDDLKHESTCADLFQFCLPYGHDTAHWNALKDANIQINFRGQVRYVNAHFPALQRLASQAKQVMLRHMAAEPVEIESVTIQEEGFDAWSNDCQHLFREHCVKVGEHPENWRNKNFPLMRKLYDAGAMQLLVGRSNGRPFGYLMTLLAPSLESGATQSAEHMTFFASEDMPGLGLKLQRAALAKLEAKGVDELILRAGVRGDGERLNTLYRRLGASDLGRMFRIELKAA